MSLLAAVSRVEASSCAAVHAQFNFFSFSLVVREKFRFTVVSPPGIAWCDRVGTPKLRPGTSASGYRSGGGVGVGIGRGGTPSHISQQRCGVCQRQLRGSQPGVSVKDTELIPYQVRQGKRLTMYFVLLRLNFLQLCICDCLRGMRAAVS